MYTRSVPENEAESSAQVHTHLDSNQSTNSVLITSGGEREDLADHELDFLLDCLKIIRAQRGCTTPIEDFLCHLITRHACRPLTPDDIERRVAELKQAFPNSIAEAAYLMRQYPHLVAKELAAWPPSRSRKA
jgi:hypothetical protein